MCRKNGKQTFYMTTGIRALVCDYDGTLTQERNIVPSALRDTLRELQANGYMCTLNTGLPYPMVPFKVGRQFTPNAAYMMEAGGRIVTPEGQTYYVAPMAEDEIAALDPYLARENLRMAAFTPVSGEAFFVYTTDPESVRARYRSPEGKQFPDEWLLTDIHTFRHLIREKGAVRVAMEGSDDSFAIPTNGDMPGSVTRNSATYEVRSEGVNKGEVIGRWAKAHGLDLSQIAICGNDLNDLDMFQTGVGMKIRVGTDCLQLAEYATHQVTDAEELAVFLQNEFLS
ncbi:MAG: hypothetical protein BRC23_01535 [Parcubacteria group bacterium SW_4_49_11]|nr:MAG: hypothetical protein BRC23_01535 [Parcubacteria group bacterium SW_4_49_11]